MSSVSRDLTSSLYATLPQLITMSACPGRHDELIRDAGVPRIALIAAPAVLRHQPCPFEPLAQLGERPVVRRELCLHRRPSGLYVLVVRLTAPAPLPPRTGLPDPLPTLQHP